MLREIWYDTREEHVYVQQYSRPSPRLSFQYQCNTTKCGVNISIYRVQQCNYQILWLSCCCWCCTLSRPFLTGVCIRHSSSSTIIPLDLFAYLKVCPIDLSYQVQSNVCHGPYLTVHTTPPQDLCSCFIKSYYIIVQHTQGAVNGGDGGWNLELLYHHVECILLYSSTAVS